MPKEEWGVKRVCPSCSTRFYDLQRDPMTCPECGHGFSLESLTNARSRTLVADKSDAKSKAAEEAPVADAEVVVDDDAEVVLDDDDLEDDVLDDDDDDDVSLDEIADVAKTDDD